MTFSDYHPGYSLPIASSASGLVFLAYTEPEDRARIIEQIRRTAVNEEEDFSMRDLQDHHFRMILEDGYASFIRNPHTKDPGKTSSIAVPLYREKELIGAMTLVFFSTSLRVVDAFEKCKDLLFETQENINRDLVAMKLFKPDELELSC